MQSPNDTLAQWATVGALVMQHAEPQRKTANPCASDQLRLENRPPLLKFVIPPKKWENCLYPLKSAKIVIPPKKCENCLYPLKSAVIPPKKCENCMYPLKSEKIVIPPKCAKMVCTP